MKGKIITGVICGGIGLFAGYKLTANKVMKLLSSDELKNELVKGFKEEFAKDKKKNNDIIFESRDEADNVCDQLLATISQYGQVSVADLHDMIGETTSFQNNKIGWTDLAGMRIIGLDGRYVLKMPKTIIL